MNNPKIPGGFILLPRASHPIDEMPSLYRDVWIYILKKARHKEDKSKGFERGECLISIPELQEALTHYVGFKKVTPTKHQIDNVFRWLRNTSTYEALYDNGYDMNTPMITTTRTTRGMVVKVGGYAFLQDAKNYEYDTVHDNENDMSTKRVRQQPDTIHKNVKELKKEKNEKNVESIVYGDDPAFNNLLSLYKDNIEKEPKPITVNKLKKDYEQYGEEILNYAIEKSTLGGNEDYRFINHLLKDWEKNGLKTIVEVKTFEDERQGGKSNQDDVFKRVATKYSNKESPSSKFDGIAKELGIYDKQPKHSRSYEKTPEWIGKEPKPSEPADEAEKQKLEEELNDFWK